MFGARPLRVLSAPSRARHGAAVLVLCVIAWLALAQSARAATLPPDFREDVIFSGLTQPTGLTFSPDGRIFVAEKSGLIKVFSDLSDTTPEVVADLRAKVHDFWDRGLLGIALDPAFPSREVLYALYTYDARIGGTAPTFGDACDDPTGRGCVVSGRLSRLTNLGAGPAQVAEQVLIEDWCQQYPSHSIGSLAFGPDGALYVSGGDGASFTFVDYGQEGNPCGDPGGATLTPPLAEGGALRSQDLRTMADPVGLDGTIIRVDPATGAGLPDNPLASSPDPNARRIVAYGLRNPFRMTVRPGTNELWVGDVGWNDWEEVNRIADPKGAVENFGWPCYEGDRSGSARNGGYDAANLKVCEDLYANPAGIVAPYFSYKHRENVIPNENCPQGGSSIAGLAFQFYTGGPYPAQYDGALFFADYSRNCIWWMERGAGDLPDKAKIRSFVGGAAAPVQLVMSPGGELFYVDIADGTVRRIRYTAPPPNAVDKALGRPASASSAFDVGYEAGLAVDGDVNTRWSSDFTDGQWWQVDLGSVRQVDRVRVDWETAYASQYRISTSTDGTTWSTAADVSIVQAGVETTSFAARGARYVRITGVQRGTAWGISFWEANVYGPDDTANRPPVAVARATPTSGEPPLQVAFDGTGSSDPDVGTTLSYAWDLDGDGAFDDSNSARPSWTYTTAGSHTASLRVSDGRGGADTASVTIAVGAPKPTIASPTTALRWAVGDGIGFSGSAVDNRGQAIPASGLTWTLVVHHGACPNCHEHVVQSWNGVASGSFSAPDHDHPSELELRLTATDASGMKGTTSVRLQPRTVAITLASAPTGLQVALSGATGAAPLTRTAIVGSATTISAPSPQTHNGTSYAFAGWSDGGGQTHTITAPGADTTYTATFRQSTEDKALNRPATASSSAAAGYGPGLAVDGNSTTRWSSGFADNEWWQVDLGAVRQVDSVRINWEAAYASRYRISTSTDGSTFSTAAEVSLSAAMPQTTTFAARGARYVRVTGLTRATPWGISFWDVNVHGPADTAPPPPSDLALNRPAAASSTYGAGYEAPRAVDGNSGTRWSSTFSDGQWWEVDLGAERQVDQVQINWEGAYASQYRISTATSPGAYSTAADVTISGAGRHTTRFTARGARWVRITSLRRATSYGISFWDVNVFGP